MTSPNPVLGVAVVGVGLVALTTHLPTLQLASHLFVTRALVDVSSDALAHAAAKFRVPSDRTYTSVDALLASPAAADIDVVMIMSANEYHVPQALAALEAGKHVLVEKPMALCMPDAELLSAAQKQSGKVVMVGTMRRYADAFLRVKELVAAEGRDSIAYVRVRDLIGHNDHFVAQGGAFPAKFNDFPAAQVAETKKLHDEQLAVALGHAPTAEQSHAYDLLASLSIHDLSAMRELIGMPTRVLCAVRSPDGAFITVTFDYGSFVAYYEVGIDDVQVFDAHIEVYTRNKRIKVTYDTPFVKGLPITASILSTRANGDHCEETVRPTYEDAFTREYRALYDAVVHGAPVKTTPDDAKLDLVLFRMIMDAMVFQ